MRSIKWHWLGAPVGLSSRAIGAESASNRTIQNRLGSARSNATLIIRTITLLLTGFAGFASAGTPYPFDRSGYLGEAQLMPDWAATMQRQHAQAKVLDACLADLDRCPRYYRGLRHLLQKAAALTPEKQIRLISHYVNKKRYRDDTSEKLDTPLVDEPVKYRSRWATVEEFMRRGGDCEDFATTKYYLLRRLGFAVDDLRVVVTWDRQARGYHAVLAVKQDNVVLLLESDDTIRRGKRHPYKFIYSVNEKSIWDHQPPATVSRIPPNRIPPNQEVTPA